MLQFLHRFLKSQSGAVAIEYALIAVVIGVGIIAGLTNLKTGLTGSYTNTANSFSAN